MYGKGISREGSLLDIGVDLGLVKKSGAWYTYDGEQLGQGRENAKLFLLDHPEVMVEISERIRSQLGIGTSAAASTSAADGNGADGNGADGNGADGNGADGNGAGDTMSAADDVPITLDD
jgi:recombination protein RecA